jgi:hypothetical protein
MTVFTNSAEILGRPKPVSVRISKERSNALWRSSKKKKKKPQTNKQKYKIKKRKNLLNVKQLNALSPSNYSKITKSESFPSLRV